MQAIQDERAAVACSQKDVISLFYFGGRGWIEEMLAEGMRKIAGVANSDADFNLEQPERDTTRKH